MVAPDAWGAPPFFEGRGSVRHPAIDRRVVNGKTSFSQHFGQIAVAQGVTYVPPHPQEDDRRCVLPPRGRRIGSQADSLPVIVPAPLLL
jgi:hypothetical protein